MAFAAGKPSTEFSIKRYIGVGSFKVIAVNPNKKELSQIYNGRDIQNEPEYIRKVTVKDKNGAEKEVTQATIDVYLQAVPEKNNGISFIQKAQFSISNCGWYSTKNGVTKLQVIDEYGRTAWATEADYQAKRIPVDRNGRALNVSANYRAAYRGEAEFTDFLINVLNIPGVQVYNRETKTWKMSENPKDSEARFEADDIKAMLKGKFDLIKQIFGLQPDNLVKMAIGVQTSDEGKLYQRFYTRKTLKNGARNFYSLQADIESALAAGLYKNTEFFIVNENGYSVLPSLVEYEVKQTSFAQAPQASVPESAGSVEEEEESFTEESSPVDDLPFD